MVITASIQFESPQYIYMTEQNGQPPILCQELSIDGWEHRVLLEIDPSGTTSPLCQYSFLSDGKNGISWYLDSHGIELNRWVRKYDGEEYLTELEFLPMAERGTMIYPVAAYRTIFGYLGEDRYFCCDTPKGPILCKNFFGEIQFMLPIHESERLEIHYKDNVIFAYDGETDMLFTFYPDGTEYHPPIQVTSVFQPAENYYEPEFGIEDGHITIWGFDRNSNYIKCVYSNGDSPIVMRIFSPDDEFYFYRFAQRGDKALVHGYNGKMFCWLISTRIPDTPPKEIFSVSFSGREPPFGNLIWVDDRYFVFMQSGHKKSKLTLYSVSGECLCKVDVPHYIRGREDICTDGQYLYVLSHEDGQWQTHNTLSIIRVF